MEATPSWLFWLCFWPQNSAGVLVLPDRISSILRITKVLIKYLRILSGSTYVFVQHKIRISVFLYIKKTQLQDFLEFLVLL